MSNYLDIYINMTSLIISLYSSFALAMIALQAAYFTHILEQSQKYGGIHNSFYLCIILSFISYGGTIFLGIEAINKLKKNIESHNSTNSLTINCIKRKLKYKILWQVILCAIGSVLFFISFIISSSHLFK